jgi:hypothetical protein
LEERRTRRKLQLFYNIQNGSTHPYLLDLIMLFKYVKNSTNFNFYFDGILIPLASDHKHLGITLSEEIKWNKHVENLIKEKDKKKKVSPNTYMYVFCVN